MNMIEEASVKYIVQSIYDYLKSKNFNGMDIAYCFYLILHKYKGDFKKFEEYTDSLSTSTWLNEVMIYNEFCDSSDSSKYRVYQIENKFSIKVLSINYTYTIGAS